MPIDGDTVQFVFSLSDSRRLLLINDSLGGCSVRAITFANNNIVNFPNAIATYVKANAYSSRSNKVHQ